LIEAIRVVSAPQQSHRLFDRLVGNAPEPERRTQVLWLTYDFRVLLPVQCQIISCGLLRLDRHAPANNRIFVTFTDSTAAIRGETSVAVETQ
jgi:hypothetical protein